MTDAETLPATVDTPVLAIDGPAGSGKSTVARQAARRLGWDHLDTGAMYRALAWAALRAGVDPSDGPAVEAVLARITVHVAPTSDTSTVLVDGLDVSGEIRSAEVSAATAAVAAHPGVRRALVARQRAWVQGRRGVVMEGRDIGSVVFPGAAAKVYLTASIEARAQRRLDERADGSVAEIAEELRRRDAQDSSREADPLRVAPDAIEIDTTFLSIAEAVDEVVRVTRQRCATPLDTTPLATTPLDTTRPAADSNDSAVDDGARGAIRTVQGPTRSQRFTWWFCRGVMLVVCKVFFRLRFEGREHLPKGPYILAPVHRSYLDSVVCAVISGRRTRYLGKEEMWRKAWMGRLWDALGGIRVARGTTDRESMRLCLDALAGGEPLAVFPEGTRRTGPVVSDIFEGAAFMAGRAGVPIVPVGIGGSEAAMRPGIDRLPRPRRIVVIVGRPIPAPTGTSGRASRSAVRATTEQLRVSLQELFDEAQAKVGTPNPPLLAP